MLGNILGIDSPPLLVMPNLIFCVQCYFKKYYKRRHMCNVHNIPAGNYAQLELNSQSGCISNIYVHSGLWCHTVPTASTPFIYFLFYFMPI